MPPGNDTPSFPASLRNASARPPPYQTSIHPSFPRQVLTVPIKLHNLNSAPPPNPRALSGAPLREDPNFDTGTPGGVLLQEWGIAKRGSHAQPRFCLKTDFFRKTDHRWVDNENLIYTKPQSLHPTNRTPNHSFVICHSHVTNGIRASDCATPLCFSFWIPCRDKLTKAMAIAPAVGGFNLSS